MPKTCERCKSRPARYGGIAGCWTLARDGPRPRAVRDRGGRRRRVPGGERPRELFGAADYPVQRVAAAERAGDDVDVG